jgi:hypothetical protein
VFVTVGDVLLTKLRPFAASLYDALTHGASFFVLYWISCVLISAGMPLVLKADKWFAQKALGVDFITLPTTLIGNDARYLKCTSQSSYTPKESSGASKFLSMLSTISILLS